MFWRVINGILMSTYGLSTVITILNNSASNSRIRRQGYKIKSIEENSVSENIKYFLKDFGFLFLPVYNLIHSIKQTAQDDSAFDNNKMNRLEDRGRLVEKSESEKAKEAKKVEEPKEEVKKESPALPARREEVKRVAPALPERRSKSFDEMDSHERCLYYKNEYDRVLSLRTNAKNDGASVAILNRYTTELESIVENYRKAQRECKINNLKEAKDSLNKSDSSEKKLIRK